MFFFLASFFAKLSNLWHKKTLVWNFERKKSKMYKSRSFHEQACRSTSNVFLFGSQNCQVRNSGRLYLLLLTLCFCLNCLNWLNQLLTSFAKTAMKLTIRARFGTELIFTLPWNINEKPEPSDAPNIMTNIFLLFVHPLCLHLPMDH